MLALGAIILAGLAADVLGRRTRLPRVTLLLVVGLGFGPHGLDLFPGDIAGWFPLVAHLSLVMVAFLLGGELTADLLRSHGRDVLVISIVVVALTAGTVGAGLWLLGWSLSIAVLLAAVATSTDPAAVTDVVRETGARGPFTRVLGSGLSRGVPSSRTLGVALLPQAGIAIGMALVIAHRMPEVGTSILSATVAGTVVFEPIGPILTRRVLERTGEASRATLAPEYSP